MAGLVRVLDEYEQPRDRYPAVMTLEGNVPVGPSPAATDQEHEVGLPGRLPPQGFGSGASSARGETAFV